MSSKSVWPEVYFFDEKSEPEEKKLGIKIIDNYAKNLDNRTSRPKVLSADKDKRPDVQKVPIESIERL